MKDKGLRTLLGRDEQKFIPGGDLDYLSSKIDAIVEHLGVKFGVRFCECGEKRIVKIMEKVEDGDKRTT